MLLTLLLGGSINFSLSRQSFFKREFFALFLTLFFAVVGRRRRRLAVLALGLLAAVASCLRRSVEVTLVQRDALWRDVVNVSALHARIHSPETWAPVSAL